MSEHERPLIEVARARIAAGLRVSVENHSVCAAAYVAGYEAGVANGVHDSRTNDETMREQLHARIAELEAQLAAHEVKRFHNGEQVMREYAARPVQGVVVDDAMVERCLKSWLGHRVYQTKMQRTGMYDALTAALSSAQLVPLASGEPIHWCSDDGNTFGFLSDDVCSIPLYRGLAPQGE